MSFDEPDSNGFAAFLSGLHPVLKRLIQFLRRRARTKWAREGVARVLGSAVALQENLEELMACGEGFVEIIEKEDVPASVNTSFRLYNQLGKWLFAAAKMLNSLADLVDQAKSLTRIEPFMDELKSLDKPLYAFVKLLAESKKDDKIDLTDFPTFAAVYVRQTRVKSNLEYRVQEIVIPLTKKAVEMGETLSPPFRLQKQTLLRAFKELEEASKRLAPASEQTRRDMLNNSPQWAGMSLDLIDAGLKSGLKISPRKVRPESPPPPPPKKREEWKRQPRRHGKP